MADERKEAAKSHKTPKGFFRLSGLLNYFSPKSPDKPKAKDRKLYRYSPRDDSDSVSPTTSPKKREHTGCEQRYRYSDGPLSPPVAVKSPTKKKADQSYRLSDELLSPPAAVKSSTRKGDQGYRLSDELRSPPAAVKSPTKKKEDRGYRLSDELRSPPAAVKSPTKKKKDHGYRLSDELRSPLAGLTSPRKKNKRGQRYRYSDEQLSPPAAAGVLSPLSPAGRTKAAGTSANKHCARTERKGTERAVVEPKPVADRRAGVNRHQRATQEPNARGAVEDIRSPINLSRHKPATQQFDTCTDMTGVVSPPVKSGRGCQYNKHTWQLKAPTVARENIWFPQMLPVYRAAQQQRQQRKAPAATEFAWDNAWCAIFSLSILTLFIGALTLIATMDGGAPFSTTDIGTETDEHIWYGQNFYPGNSMPKSAHTAPSTPKAISEKLPSTHVCVYRVSAEGRREQPGALPYGVDRLPLDSCNLVVYCCARLSDQYAPEPRAAEKNNFELLRNMTAAIRPWQQIKVLIGDGIHQPDRFKLLLENDAVAAKLAHSTASWCKRLGYSGVFVQWPRGDIFTWNAIVASLTKLQKLFLNHLLTVGTVLSQPVDYGAGDELYGLADVLGDASILLRPPSYVRSDFYPKTFSYYTGQRLKALASIANSVNSAKSRRSLCLMVPANALAFLVDDPQSAPLGVLEDEASNGPAPPSKTSPPGQRSSYEVCAATAKMSNVRGVSYHVLARGHGLWLSYTTLFRLGAFLDEAKDHGFSCGGVWNSEMDDFANLCDSGGPYPLVTAAGHQFFSEPEQSTP